MAKTVPHEEVLKFLTQFLEGVLTTGTVEPLISLSSNDTSFPGQMAQSILALQLEGMSPEDAFLNASPGLPSPLVDFLVLGFETSQLDRVLQTAIEIYQNSPTDALELIEAQIEKLNTEDISGICQSCAEEEWQKILHRSRINSAKRVVICLDDGKFLRQIYFGVKLTIVSEPFSSRLFPKFKEYYETHPSLSSDLRVEWI